MKMTFVSHNCSCQYHTLYLREWC